VLHSHVVSRPPDITVSSSWSSPITNDHRKNRGYYHDWLHCYPASIPTPDTLPRPLIGVRIVVWCGVEASHYFPLACVDERIGRHVWQPNLEWPVQSALATASGALGSIQSTGRVHTYHEWVFVEPFWRLHDGDGDAIMISSIQFRASPINLRATGIDSTRQHQPRVCRAICIPYVNGRCTGRIYELISMDD
jgi:hypothetical protein